MENQQSNKQYPALEAGVQDKAGKWYNLTAYEKEGKLQGALQVREGTEYQKAPIVLEEKSGRLGATVEIDDRKLYVTLAQSQPTEKGNVKVDFNVKQMDKGPDGKTKFTPLNARPGRLRANAALQAIPDHREGKLIREALGVEPKMLKLFTPVPMPQKTQGRTQEVAR